MIKNALFKIRDVIRKANFFLVVTLMACMMAIVILQTLSRYFLKLPLFWAEELARYLMIWLCFTGSAVVIREGGHVSVMYLISKMSKNAQKYSIIFVKLLMIGFLLFLVIEGYTLIQMVSRQLSPTMRISMAWPYLAIPFGSALMIFEILMTFFEN